MQVAVPPAPPAAPVLKKDEHKKNKLVERWMAVDSPLVADGRISVKRHF